MTAYYVTIPFAGSVTVYVEAEDAKAAEGAAWEKAECRMVSENEACDVGEWELFQNLVRGNSCSAPVWELSVEEAD